MEILALFVFAPVVLASKLFHNSYAIQVLIVYFPRALVFWELCPVDAIVGLFADFVKYLIQHCVHSITPFAAAITIVAGVAV